MARLAFAFGILVSSSAFASLVAAEEVHDVAVAELPAADSVVANAADLEFFEKKIRPLLHQRCLECHGKATGGSNGELFLDTAAGLRNGGSRGKAVVAGKPDESLIIKAIRYVDSDLEMPPEGKLPAAEIELLTDWVRRGAVAPNDAAVAVEAKTIDIAAGKQFWSFQPLKSSPSPEVKNKNWKKTSVDDFVLAKLEEAGIAPAEEADRRTLLRRATFDLTGLPPTREAMEEFLADDRPDAFERQVDRLLSSPQFGEQAARKWLDLARYTDTVAWWLKGTENAWLYRDWVVQSFNEDRPFDDFVRQQLAADLIADSTVENLAALGFLGLSPTYWKELRLAPNVIQTVVCDEWDERIDVVSRTFLGLTVSCARCHPHKFDPFTMEDYYGLAGVFASCQLGDRPLLPEPRASAVRKAKSQLTAWEADLKKVKDQNSDAAKEWKAKIETLRKENPDVDRPWAHVVEEAALFVLPDGDDKTKLDVRQGVARDLPVFRRGNPGNPGDIAPRRFLSVLSPGEPRTLQHGSGRGDLAEAIVSEAKSLTARVIVNRLWAHYFGRGLVGTVSDFGSQGERPSHPDLLDELALRFVKRDWSLKWLHREMVTSAAYRQSSRAVERSIALDPDNRLVSRHIRRRLDVEAWRDGLLAAAGQLQQTMGGPSRSLDEATNTRRTLYGTVGRHEQNDMLRLYDFPEPATHSPNRVPTTTPLQQLFVLNSPFLDRLAMEMAKQATVNSKETTVARITRLYGNLLQRAPTPEELALGVEFLAAGDGEAWRAYARALLGLNELISVD